MFRRRECLVPTWRGLLAVVVFAAAATWVAAISVYPFLAVNAPAQRGVLVVEGWLPDYALKEAIQEYANGGHSKLYVTGGPLEAGAPLSEYRSYAELGAAVLMRLGMDTNALEAVPAPKVRADRTYASALALRRHLAASGRASGNLTVVSEGPHARRSRLLFAKAFGPEVRIGIISITPEYYEPRRWWRSSQGVRTVIGETLAYMYARLVFSPKGELL